MLAPQKFRYSHPKNSATRPKNSATGWSKIPLQGVFGIRQVIDQPQQAGDARRRPGVERPGFARIQRRGHDGLPRLENLIHARR